MGDENDVRPDEGLPDLPEVSLPPLPELPPLPWEQQGPEGAGGEADASSASDRAPAEAPAPERGPVPPPAPAPTPADRAVPPAPAPPAFPAAPVRHQPLAPQMFPTAPQAPGGPGQPPYAPGGPSSYAQPAAQPPYAQLNQAPYAPPGQAPYGSPIAQAPASAQGYPPAPGFPQPVPPGYPQGGALGGPFAAAAPQKRGFPAWAGWLIGAGAVVVIAAVVVVGLVVGLLPGGDEPVAKGVDTSGPAAGEDGSSGSSDGSETSGGGEGGSGDADGGSSDGAITMDDTVPGGADLGWASPDTSGDEWEVFYEDGDNFVGLFTRESGDLCNVTANSMVRTSSDGATSDGAATQADIDEYYARLQKTVDETYDDEDDKLIYDVAKAEPMAFAAGGAAVEFAGYDVTTSVGGYAGSPTRTYWRSFADGGKRLSIDISCTGQGGDAAADDLFAQFTLK